ncbi:ATP-dependent DNA helicase [Halopenitus sp. POP-27]|uniref:UvrD-helicase domain-containing protein n=1 Tax=Halopenitus sp. POP-27 TaxID=2994425 RepID=UPI0024692EA1|nr:ATP-dependent DNA helicase [Halopenitus sp. POP-27]
MTEYEPNDRQQELIDATSGIHVVDAGAGTGKTFTITRRYANLLEQEDVEPEDTLLITFTRNAAGEMTERVVANCDYSMAALRDAPIDTFHGYCHDLLLRHGFDAPTRLGIDDRITSSTRLLENEVIEEDRFREFLDGFIEAHPEHHDFVRTLTDSTSLLDLITQLAAKGVFPTDEGWFRDGESVLDGDEEAFETLFEAANEPNEGANGPTQSDLRAGLSGFDRDRCYDPDAPSESDLRDGYPRIDDAWAGRAFDEDREDLKAFVHDVYFEYIAFALRRNYLNFSFLLMFTFAMLCEDHSLRESVQFDHVLVDEFQDTSEIQFKLALLLAGTDNLCVVGDWKQSIYGFQYASVDNIRRFEERLRTYKRELNGDHTRVEFPVDDVNEIALVENYRSTQSILDFSEHSLTLPATGSEDVDPSIRDDVTSLVATTDHDHSTIEAFTSEDEQAAILTRIQEIVGNREYAVEVDGDGDQSDGDRSDGDRSDAAGADAAGADVARSADDVDDADADDELRVPTYDDIAVLTRTRDFGRELQACAADYGIPVAYEGGVELFGTEQSILLLAWLRILEDEDSTRGWAVVLEEAGYTLDEVTHVLGTGAYPATMVAFRDRLAAAETVGGIARRVFDRYGFDDAYADGLVSLVQGTFESTHHNRGDIVRFLERSLEADATHDVEDAPGGDSVTVQTIHAAKGLEHPIVIVANVNRHRFPPSGGGADRIRYEEPVGLRQSKRYTDAHGRPHLYDNWRYRILSACLGREYDEERRLLYVAITRARSHVLFSAGESPSPFFETLPLEPSTVDPNVEEVVVDGTDRTPLQVSVPVSHTPSRQSPHSLMDDDVFGDVEEGMGTAFGTRVHEFAEEYALGRAVEPTSSDERTVRTFLDSLPGELRVEEHVSLPVSVDGHRVTIAGIVDLLHVTDDRVEIVDYKTDRGRHAESEYRKQVSVYYHVVRHAYPDRRVTTSIYYTADGERVAIDPLSIADLEGLVDVDETDDDRGHDPRVR